MSITLVIFELRMGCLTSRFSSRLEKYFAHDASFTTVKSIFDQDSKYNDVNHLVTFIDNHDRDRFLCLADDNYQKLRLALTYIFTVRGIPDVYYGTEQNCYGGGVPTEWAGIANKENREVMPYFMRMGLP